MFRLGPFGMNVPTARFYEPGTNTVSTTWNTPTGWILVRDALTMGPSRGEDEITPHTRPPADDDADHLLVRTVLCLEGNVEIELICEPAFDYGRAPAEWTMEGDDRHTADATGAGQTVRLRTDMSIGIEGDRVRARHVVKQGDQVYCSLSWSEELDSPQDIDEANARMAATQRFWRGWLGRARNIDHRWRQPIQRSALTIKGLTYMPTGATVAALTTSLPETPGGERNWDYRYTWMRDYDVHPPGAPLAPARLGGRRVHGVRGRSRGERGRRASDHVRHRRAARPHRVHARRAVRVHGSEPGADRQRRLRPAPERRVRRGARLDPAAHPAQPATAPATVADRAVSGGMRHRRMAQSRPGDLGGPRRAAALRVVQAHVLGGTGPGRQAGEDSRRPGARSHMGRHRRGDKGGHPGARREGRRAPPALRNRRAGRVHAPGGDLRLPAGRRRAPAQVGRRDRRAT